MRISKFLSRFLPKKERQQEKVCFRSRKLGGGILFMPKEWVEDFKQEYSEWDRDWEEMSDRELWLADMNAEEKDVLEDEDGEFIYKEEEVGTASETGYDIYNKKVYLPSFEEEEKMECDICGSTGDDVSYRPDAYARDVHNDSNAYHTVCDKCDQETKNDI